MIFKRKIQIIFILLLSLSSFVVFNFFEFYHTNNDYWYYFHNNHLWDETNTYFIKLFLINNNIHSFNTNDDSFIFFITFFSFIQNFILYKIFDFKYLDLTSNIFIFFTNFYLFYLIFKKIFDISNIHKIYLACLFTLTLGYGPQTYNEIFQIISLNNFDLIAASRSESPGNSNICFLISLLLFFNRDKNLIFLILSLLIGFYSYFFNTLILFVFFNLIFLNDLIKNKFKFNKYLYKSIFLTSLFFLLWCYLILQSDPYGNFQSLSNKTSPNDFKTFLISIIYISINLLSFKLSNKKINLKNNSLYLIFFQISFLICYYSNLFTNISLAGEDRFYYFSNISYWLTFFNFLFIIKKNFIKLISILFPIFATFLFVSQFNYSSNYFDINKENLRLQKEYFKSVDEIKKYLIKKNITVLDMMTINFFNYYFSIDNQLINYQNNQYNSKERLDRFIKTCHIINISQQECYELLFKKSKIIEFKKNINMTHIFFGLDLDDNFYHSLTDKKFHMSEFKDKFNLFYRKHSNLNNLPSLIIFNHIDYPEITLKKFNYQAIFKNNFFTVMEKI